MLRIVILLLLLAPRAGAGAWPQPRGEGHLCFSFEGVAKGGSPTYATLYTEYGLGRGRTAGLDLGLADTDVDKAVAFLRWSFGPRGGDTVMAYEMGVGRVDGLAALRPGLSLGRGLRLGRNAGWVALDARGVLLEGLEGRIEADLTLGADTGNGDKWLVQLQMAAPSDSAPYVRVAPSYALRQKNGRHLLLGVTAGIVGTDDVKLSLGLWQKF